MALSSSESALLTQTCENMNIAANTCREVLEMLRNLGNTGVVDIATHSNAATAHNNASNLVKYNPTSKFAYIGTYGAVNGAPNTYPVEIWGYEANTNPILLFSSETKGGAPKYVQYKGYIYATDSGGDLINLETAGTSLGLTNSLAALGNVGFHIFGLESGVESNRFAGVLCYAGAFENIGDFRYTSVVFMVGNGTTDSTCLQIKYNSIFPTNNNGMSLGLSSRAFDTAYLGTAASITSDRREKSGISAIGSEAVDFIKALRPVHFTVKVGKQNVLEADEDGNPTNVETIPGTRRHWGLIAQEVQEALVSAGYDPSACAVWCLADKNDPDSKQALRYEELIAPMIKVIQNQQERIEALERRVA